MEQQTQQVEVPIVHEFEGNAQKPMKNKMLVIFVVSIVLGLVSGFAGVSVKGQSSITGGASGVGEKNSKGIVVGSSQKTFKDSAEGSLKEGGVDGEGAYHLERPGGASQNVYLTSSTLDLSSYVGKKIKVWGETYSAKKAGWLMDVGRLQVIN